MTWVCEKAALALARIGNLCHFHFNSENVNCVHYNPKKAQPISCYLHKRLLHKTFNIIGASVNLICRSLMCVLIIQFGLKLKLHNRNEIEPHWAPGPSFPGFGSNTVRFSWPRVTGQVHLGHHSLPSARQFCQRPQSRHYSIGYAEHLSYNSMIIIE